VDLRVDDYLTRHRNGKFRPHKCKFGGPAKQARQALVTIDSIVSQVTRDPVEKAVATWLGKACVAVRAASMPSLNNMARMLFRAGCQFWWKENARSVPAPKDDAIDRGLRHVVGPLDYRTADPRFLEIDKELSAQTMERFGAWPFASLSIDGSPSSGAASRASTWSVRIVRAMR
jgi:hypothetical protein